MNDPSVFPLPPKGGEGRVRGAGCSCVILNLLAVIAAGPVRAGGSGVSEVGELDLPVSALAAAVGGPSAGLVEDASAVTDNPARLGAVAPAGVAVTHTVWPLGFSDSLLAMYGSLPRLGSLGGQVRLFRVDVPKTNEQGGDTGMFSYQTLQVAVACAPDLRFLNEYVPVKIRAGAAVFLVQRDIAGDQGNGVGGNAGVTAEVARGFELYVTGRNLGGVEGVAMPMASSLGLSGRRAEVLVANDRFSGAIEGMWSREAGAGGGVAVEYALRGNALEVALRTGYTLSTAELAGTLPTVGLAVRIAHLSLEVGVASLGDLGVAKVLSLSYQERRAD